MSFRFFAAGRLKWWLLATSAVLVVVTGLLMFRRGNSPEIIVSRETTFLEGPIDADGYVDYVAALNAKMAEDVTPKNNAVVLLARALGPAKIPESIRREFFAKLEIPVPPQQGAYFLQGHEFAKGKAGKDPQTYAVALKTEIKKGGEAPWSRKELPKLAAWLRENEKPLAIVIQATGRHAWYCPIVLPGDGGGTLLDLPLPVTKECSGFAKALAARSMLAVREGRVDDAQSDLLACRRLARLVVQGHSLIHFLVGTAIETRAFKAETAALQTDRMTAKQLADYQQALEKLQPLKSPAEKFNFGERLHVLDVVVKMAKGTLNHGDEDSDANPLEDMVGKSLLSLVYDWNIVLKTINDRFDRAYAIVRQPRFILRKKAMDDHESFLEEREVEIKQVTHKSFSSSAERSRAFGHILCSIYDAALFQTSASYDRAVTRLQLTVIAVALERYRKAHGRFPAKLAGLQPRFLKKIPADLYLEKPFRYKPKKNGYLLYSVGENSKDDGGKTFGSEPAGDDLVVRITLAK